MSNCLRPVHTRGPSGGYQRKRNTGLCGWSAVFIIGTPALQPVHGLNRLIKYAEDSYLPVGSGNIETVQDEIKHIKTRATGILPRLVKWLLYFTTCLPSFLCLQ